MDRRTINNPKNPAAPAVSTYIGIDAVIEAMRLQLDTDLEWIDKAWHKAFKSYRASDRPSMTGTEIYPRIWQGHKVDMLDVIMNDNLSGFLYFYTEGNETPAEDWQPAIQNIWQKRVNLIVWVNLDRADTTKQYSYTEDLKQEIRNSLGMMTMPEGSSFTLVDIIESDGDPENIFSPFTIDLVKSQYFSFPRYGFRFSLDVTYTDECLFIYQEPTSQYFLSDYFLEDYFL